MRVIEQQLQLAVNKILDWCDHNGHTLSPSKSSSIHLCRKRALHNDPVIFIHNIAIPVVPHAKFLGVTFDSKLTFIPHIKQLRKRCEQKLNMLRVLSNTYWGADRLALLRIYRALILSRLDYACVVYGTATTSNLRILDTVHHTALRICSGAFRTSPVESLYVVCHQIPLYLRRIQLSLTYYFSIMSSKSHPLKHDVISSSLERLYIARPSHIPPLHARTRSLIQSFDICELPSQSVDHFLIPPWTISPYQSISLFKLHDKANVTPCIFHTLFTAHRHQYSHNIYRFIQTKNGFESLFCWVPSHAGIPGNELADTAARSATSVLKVSIPFSDMKLHTRKLVTSLWQQQWDLKVLNKLQSIKFDFDNLPVLRLCSADVKLTRLRIGHTRLTHLHLLFGELPPECSTCYVPLTVHHILIRCPCFNQLRLKLFGSTILCLQDLLDDTHHPNIFAFLRAVGIFNSI
nr:uncharacterized protein LOC122271807 [Parasteatoda tepidariorum]